MLIYLFLIEFMILNKLNTILLLVLIFLLSVLIRVPDLDRPLSKHHEFLTAISLRILQIWEKEGASNLRFLPRMNYEGKANKQINNHASTTGNMKDQEGNFYYVSHPPLAFILAYGFHFLLHLKVSVLSIQVFNLLFHFLSSIFIYLILLEFFGKRSSIPFIGFIIYLFDPSTLWFQSNTYMSDILVHFFFITTIFFLVKSKKTDFSFKSKNTFLLYLSLFLMCSCSYLGYFTGGVMALFFLYKTKEQRSQFFHFLLVCFICSLTLYLTVSHYSQIAGIEHYLDQMKNRYAERGIGSNGDLFHTFVALFKKYLIIILNTFINHGIVLSLLIFVIFRYRKLAIDTLKRIPKHLFLFSFLPVLLLNLFLPDYCGHDFTTLYLSVTMTILLTWLTAFNFPISEKLERRTIILLSIYIFVSSLWYYVENLPGPNSIKGKPYAEGMNIGNFIKERSKKDLPVIIISKDVLGPETVFYAERNIFEARDKEEALYFLHKNHYTAGNLITLTKENRPMHLILSE